MDIMYRIDAVGRDQRREGGVMSMVSQSRNSILVGYGVMFLLSSLKQRDRKQNSRGRPGGFVGKYTSLRGMVHHLE